MYNNDYEIKWKYDELPTPKTEEECINVINTTNKELLKLANSNGWDLIDKKNNIILEKKSINGSNIDIVKSTLIIEEIDIDELAKFYIYPTFEQRKSIYHNLLSNNIIENNEQSNFNITYSQFEGEFGVDPREFITIKSIKKFDNGYMITSCSINYEDIPFNNNFIRGVNKSGIILIPAIINNKHIIKLTSIDHIDPKGNIPSFVVNIAHGKMMEKLIEMNHIFKSIIN
jgi:hypothetical protein